MLDFPRWKTWTILLACAFFVLTALPSALTEQQRATLPEWMPSRTVALGLDLQGGSHLLLKVDFDSYLREHLDNMLDQLRLQFRKEGVKYAGLNVHGQTIDVRLTSSSDLDQIRKLARQVDTDLGVVDTQENLARIGYHESGIKRLREQVLEKSIEIVGRRVNETGTREPIIQRQGLDRILLQVPGLQDPQLLKKLLGRTAKMTFHLLDLSVSPESGAMMPIGTRLLPGREKDASGRSIRYAIKQRALLSGEMLVDASTSRDQMGRPAVSFRFNPVGAKRFGEITTENVGKPFAIVLDGEVITAPRINEPILGGNGIISGSFTPEESHQLAMLLRSGSLPAPLNVIEERTVGPSLGADSIEAGKMASIIGVVMVVVFMFLAYGLFGVFADIALMINIVMILAFLSLFQATLTMPGIAGIVLTIGMAVDANVLIFERIREEATRGKSAFASVESGFRTAFGTILDSNITTLIAAVLLFYFGSGSVKGFAVTLSIGILSSMFSAIALTRLMVATWMRRKRPKVLPL